MRLPNLVRVSGGALLLSLLSGCVPTDAVTSPDPTPTFVAPYATDEEALAAAEAAYAEYSRVAEAILHEGGAAPERLAAVAVDPLLASSIESFNEQFSAGHTGFGDSSIKSVELQRYSQLGPGAEIITVYLCEDLSQIDVVDVSGNSVVTKNRNDTILLQVTFDFIGDSKELKLSAVEKWQDEPC